MAVKNTILGGTDFTTPDARIKPTDLNDTFDAAGGWVTMKEILELDTTTDFDFSVGPGGASPSHSKEYTISWTASEVPPNYLKVKVLGTFKANNGSSTQAHASVSLSIQAKETGEAYSTRYSKEVVNCATYTSGQDNMIDFLFELTAGEKANGLVVRIGISGIPGSSSAGSIVFSNDQIVIEGA